jgi:hypothetical protein
MIEIVIFALGIFHCGKELGEQKEKGKVVGV